MTSEPQDTADHEHQHEHDEPNEQGFAGDPSTPTPEPGSGEGFGESIAVPSGDITGSLMAAINEAGEGHQEDDDQKS